MKKKLTYLITCLFLVGLFAICFYAQTNLALDDLREKISGFESEDITTMSQSAKEIYVNELLRLYDNYINFLNQEISSLSRLEKISDSEGKISKKRVEAEQERTKTQNKANIFRENLKNSGTIQPPKKEDSIAEKTRDKNVNDKLDKPTLPPIAATETKTNSFDNAPVALKDEAKKLAELIIFDIDEGNFTSAKEELSNKYPIIYSLSVVSGFDIEQTNNPVFNLEPMRFLVETARTDKQIGASSATAASTSAIDKPGFASLLGFAIENGFIEKDVQDTVLTLSTSPSALFSITEKDTTKAYQRAGVFNKIGLSASFNINSDNPLLANAKRSQLREYSVRYRFYGDRSSRSKELEKIWRNTIAPLLAEQFRATNVGNITIDDDINLQKVRKETEGNLVKLLDGRIASGEFKALTKEKKIEDLTNLVLNFVNTGVVQRVKTKQIEISQETQNKLRLDFADALRIAQRKQKEALAGITEQLDTFFKGPLGTVAYINHREPLGNYSEFKFLFEHNGTVLKPLKFLANAGLSFYHKPNTMMNQQKMRDFNIALSLEGKTSSPFTETEDLSQITYTFTGRYRRMFENRNMPDRKADLANFQFLVNFPFLRGLALPISVTYSNATELERKQGVQFNFGLKLDTDKLFEDWT